MRDAVGSSSHIRAHWHYVGMIITFILQLRKEIGWVTTRPAKVQPSIWQSKGDIAPGHSPRKSHFPAGPCSRSNRRLEARPTIMPRAIVSRCPVCSCPPTTAPGFQGGPFPWDGADLSIALVWGTFGSNWTVSYSIAIQTIRKIVFISWKIIKRECYWLCWFGEL